MAKILLVDDEATMVQMVTESLRAAGHEVHPFTSGAAAIEGMDEIGPELVITDLYLDKTKAFGLDILQKARAINPPAVVIMITAFGSIETAVGAMKKGAYDYLEKPFKLDELKLCVQRALSYSDAVSENFYLRKQLKKKYQFDQIIGVAPRMLGMFKMIERVASTDNTILILGESGTGKELVARALHYNSRRQFGPFVPINCTALPENLLESELFGHRKGAFTGALMDKKGLFQEAEGGTIFLDEIGSMPAALQSRLLRVLQEKEVRRVGDNLPVYVNVRVVAATNEPLEQRVKEGTFREDLYYRLNVIPLVLPPLRERLEDIPLLVSHFLKHKNHPRDGQSYQITRRAMETMAAYAWPGNVRELENAIARACALAETHILGVEDLPPVVAAQGCQPAASAAPAPSEGTVANPMVLSESLYPLSLSESKRPNRPTFEGKAPVTVVPSLRDFLRDQEALYLHQVLSHVDGDKDRAVALLGISAATLYRKLAEADVEGD